MREEMLTVEEVAEWLKLNQQTVRNWIDRGELKALRVGRLVRIPASELDRFMAVAGGTPPAETSAEPPGDLVESTDDLAVAISEILRTAASSGSPDAAAALRTLAEAAARFADDGEESLGKR